MSALDDFKAAREALVVERAALLKRVEEIDEVLGQPSVVAPRSTRAEAAPATRSPRYGAVADAVRHFLAATPGATPIEIQRATGFRPHSVLQQFVRRGKARRVGSGPRDGRYYLNLTAEAAQ